MYICVLNPVQLNFIPTCDVLSLAGHNLKLTELHLIYVYKQCNGVSLDTLLAKEVEMGDCVRVTNDDNQTQVTRVVSNKRVDDRGIFSPVETSDNTSHQCDITRR